jgi:hypothetical protein
MLNPTLESPDLNAFIKAAQTAKAGLRQAVNVAVANEGAAMFS